MGIGLHNTTTFIYLSQEHDIKKNVLISITLAHSWRTFVIFNESNRRVDVIINITANQRDNEHRRHRYATGVKSLDWSYADCVTYGVYDTIRKRITINQSELVQRAFHKWHHILQEVSLNFILMFCTYIHYAYRACTWNLCSVIGKKK